MKFIDALLHEIEGAIISGNLVSVETERVELKDNSHGNSEWNEVFKTVNAFLNRNGGLILIGIREDSKTKKYSVPGFDFSSEEKLKTLKDAFVDDSGRPVDVSPNVQYETRNLLGKKVLLLSVEGLADDQKYLFFKGTAYERILTGDHKIPAPRIEAQQEYKRELTDARELRPVPGATLQDLDVDKLNDYIHLLNADVRVETIKPDIEAASSFLERQNMLRQGVPTLLGMLVCGKHPAEKLHFRSQLDAFVEVESAGIAQDKKIINNTVLQIIEQGIAFVNRNIQTGISTEQGGAKTFEYPERLVRECLNNSLAHRDYTLNQFVSVRITPGRHLKIRNPGRFKQQLLLVDTESPTPIRRIIPSSKATNPRLAKVLSVYDKWEGKAYGMATLTGACLNDRIDVPYYTFHPDEVELTIPKGPLVDAYMEALFESYSGYLAEKLDAEITVEQKRILTYFYKSELRNKEDRFTILLTKDNNHLQAVQSLEEAGLILRSPVGNQYYPVFVTDPVLFKTDFRKELRNLFGAPFQELSADYKEALAYIYERNHFAAIKYPSANEVGRNLWLRKGLGQTLEGYESHNRKVRYFINKLEKGGFLKRVDGSPKYQINHSFSANTDLFEIL